MKINTLDKWFSIYIRLRDADENGFCRCFTCGAIRYWRHMDAGHGIGRQHEATRYNEKNCHSQCKPDNAFEGGKREQYKLEMDKRYGAGTWDKMELLSRIRTKRSAFDIKVLSQYFQNKARALAKEKGIAI